MIRSTIAAFLVAFLLSGPALAAPPPPPWAAGIALTRADVPRTTAIVARLTDFVSPRQLNGDTVPSGLTVKHLKQAGFLGLYTQTLQRPNDDIPYGYPWAYIALANASAAHMVYRDWVTATKRPFNYPKGKSNVASECRVYQSVLSTHIIGLLCRIGQFVIFGHYIDRKSVEGMMRHVVARALHARP
jgi:hypothetical protein